MFKSLEEIKDFIVKCLEDKKASDIVLIDLCQSALARYMIIASGRSVKNVGAIADYVSLELKQKAGINVNIEGSYNSEWVLIDSGDIIVHIFHPETRSRFKLEEIWAKKH